MRGGDHCRGGDAGVPWRQRGRKRPPWSSRARVPGAAAELLGRTGSHDRGLYLGPVLDHTVGELPMLAHDHAVGFGKTSELDRRRA